ncbi:Hypothetical Protein FCC1311_104572 [Hondaea fermentalgiana]|uniref:Uncharacterized protein n=1 Tax=Hondaea fermentalgiana TaxID=2315210 RepID=A0A2R5GZN3_9STRA|nr:Hypothetical Protein FCC1311_104572 [Hondaea fermentalgiana]|eukprot:GBG34233.1 Hypothetical Protein FCC1311_104572 [Hondaea fermentalgiana]
MMRYSLALLLLATATVSALGGSLRDTLQLTLEQTMQEKPRCEQKSDIVCYEILDAWWSDREALKVGDELNEMDSTCSQFTDYPDACNNARARTRDVIGTTLYDRIKDNEEELRTPCTMVGAKSKRCIGNPCNQYNLGTCTVQETQGQCFWYTKEMVKEVNKYYDEHPDIEPRKIPGHGCYRNPCNLPGEGTVFQCTYCKGPGDRCLKKRGMGCQMTKAATEAECAPINEPIIPKYSIYQRRDK